MIINRLHNYMEKLHKSSVTNMFFVHIIYKNANVMFMIKNINIYNIIIKQNKNKIGVTVNYHHMSHHNICTSIIVIYFP